MSRVKASGAAKNIRGGDQHREGAGGGDEKKFADGMTKHYCFSHIFVFRLELPH